MVCIYLPIITVAYDRRHTHIFDHNIIYDISWCILKYNHSYVTKGTDTRMILNSTFVSVETEPRAQCGWFLPGGSLGKLLGETVQCVSEGEPFQGPRQSWNLKRTHLTFQWGEFRRPLNTGSLTNLIQEGTFSYLWNILIPDQFSLLVLSAGVPNWLRGADVSWGHKFKNFPAF
jgi:hypothetical protein